jgi:hypothetical protein
MATSYDLQGVRVFVCAPEGKKLRSGRDAIDLIAEAHAADLILVPVERFDGDFFRLRSGLAGEFIQKFVTYGRRLAILGDISRHVAESAALRDLVHEANRGEHFWFVANLEELNKRIRPPSL